MLKAPKSPFSCLFSFCQFFLRSCQVWPKGEQKIAAGVLQAKAKSATGGKTYPPQFSVEVNFKSMLGWPWVGGTTCLPVKLCNAQNNWVQYHSRLVTSSLLKVCWAVNPATSFSSSWVETKPRYNLKKMTYWQFHLNLHSTAYFLFRHILIIPMVLLCIE